MSDFTFSLTPSENPLTFLANINALLTDRFSRSNQHKLEDGRAKLYTIAENGVEKAGLVVENSTAIDLVYNNGRGFSKDFFDQVTSYYKNVSKTKRWKIKNGNRSLYFPLLQESLVVEYSTSLLHNVYRIPSGLILDELHHTGFFAPDIFELPDNLTVMGDVQFDNYGPSVLPKNLKVHGHFSSKNSNEIIRVEDGVTLLGYSKLNVSNACHFGEKSYINYLTITCKSNAVVFTGTVESTVVDIRSKGSISGLTVVGNLEIRELDDVADRSKTISVSNVHATKGLDLQHLPDISCQNIKCEKFYVNNCLNCSFTNIESKDWVLDYSLLNSLPSDFNTPDNLVVHGNLEVIVPVPMKGLGIGKRTLVMGNCKIPEGTLIPESFCCLGQVTN